MTLSFLINIAWAWFSQVLERYDKGSSADFNIKRPDIGCWPGIVSSYYDRELCLELSYTCQHSIAYVASIWNSYRKAGLIVLSIIISCHRRINSFSNGLEIDTSTHKDITALTEGIVSSIPYLLAADLQDFVDKTTAGSPSVVSGRPVGGLLLMYTLYVLLTLPIVEPKLKVYIRDCLAWIGTHMGIGQATILSKVKGTDKAASSEKLTWILVHNDVSIWI